MEPPPVVLAMDVPNRRCVKRIRRALWNVPGVSRVSASRRTGMVVVRGDTYMDARTLKRRLEHAMERRVTIVGDGGRPEREEMMPYAPSAAYHYHYAPPPAAYPYPYPPPPPYYYGQRQYGGPSSLFDDTVPGNACTIL